MNNATFLFLTHDILIRVNIYIWLCIPDLGMALSLCMCRWFWMTCWFALLLLHHPLFLPLQTLNSQCIFPCSYYYHKNCAAWSLEKCLLLLSFWKSHEFLHDGSPLHCIPSLEGKNKTIIFPGLKKYMEFQVVAFFLLKAKSASAGSNVFYAQFANWFSWGAVRAKSCLSNKYGRQSITTNHSLFILFSLINKCTNWFIKVFV